MEGYEKVGHLRRLGLDEVKQLKSQHIYVKVPGEEKLLQIWLKSDYCEKMKLKQLDKLWKCETIDFSQF